MRLSVNADGAAVEIRSAEQVSVVHFPFRMLCSQLSFQLHPDYRDSSENAIRKKQT